MANVATTSRAWNRSTTTNGYAAKCAFAVGSNVYVVTQDTGASPKLRVHKSPALVLSFTEQDSSNALTIATTALPFTAYATATHIHVFYFSATNTVTHGRFSLSSDTWTTGFGAVTTDAWNQDPIRGVVRSDGDVLLFYNSNADSADVAYARYEGSSWTATTIANITDGGASGILDVVIDSVDNAHCFYLDANADDVSWISISSANVASSVVDLDTSAIGSDASRSTGNFDLYTVGGVLTVDVAYRDSDDTIDEITVTLDAAATGSNVGTQIQVEGTTANVGANTIILSALSDGIPYVVWRDDANSGTFFYSTKSGGTWAARTSWKTQTGGGITTATTNMVVQALATTVGLIVVYQDGTTLKAEYLAYVATNASMGVAVGTFAGRAVTATGDANASAGTATATGAAQQITSSTPATANMGTATATGAAQQATATGAANASAGASSLTGAAAAIAATGTANASMGVATVTATAQLVTAKGDAVAVMAAASASASASAITATGSANAAMGAAQASAAARAIAAIGDAWAAMGASSATGAAQSITVTLGFDAFMGTASASAVAQALTATGEALAEMGAGFMLGRAWIITAEGSAFTFGNRPTSIVRVRVELRFVDRDRVDRFIDRVRVDPVRLIVRSRLFAGRMVVRARTVRGLKRTRILPGGDVMAVLNGLFDFYRGDTVEEIWQFFEDANNTTPVEGFDDAVIVFTARDQTTDAIVFSMSTADYMTITDAPNAIVAVSIPPVATQALALGVYPYDIELTESTGRRTTIELGSMTVKKDYTRHV